MEKIKLRADSLGITVYATKSEIEQACRSILGWRTPTKKYNSIFERFMNSGTFNYDRIIFNLHKGE